MLTRSDKLALMAASIYGAVDSLDGSIRKAEDLLREVESSQSQLEDYSFVVDFGENCGDENVISITDSGGKVRLFRECSSVKTIRSAALDEAIAVCKQSEAIFEDQGNKSIARQIARGIESLKSQPSKEKKHG